MSEINQSNECFSKVEEVKEAIERLKKEAAEIVIEARSIFEEKDPFRIIAKFKEKRGENKSFYEYFNQIPHRYACLRIAEYLFQNVPVKEVLLNPGSENSASEPGKGNHDIWASFNNQKIVGEVFWVSKSLFNGKNGKEKKKLETKVNIKHKFIAFNKDANDNYKPKGKDIHYFFIPSKPEEPITCLCGDTCKYFDNQNRKAKL